MTQKISTASWSERELDLFDAFKAGFDATADGFNGESVGLRFSNPDVLHDELLQCFVEWRNR